MIGIETARFTKTEQRIIDLFMDGRVHSVLEVASIIDEFACERNVRTHLCKLRKKLDEIGLLISFVISNGSPSRGYQMSRRLIQDR